MALPKEAATILNEYVAWASGTDWATPYAIGKGWRFPRGLPVKGSDKRNPYGAQYGPEATKAPGKWRIFNGKQFRRLGLWTEEAAPTVVNRLKAAGVPYRRFKVYQGTVAIYAKEVEA